jgi:guanylate kinase
MLVILSGVSGVGKNTIISKLMNNHKNIQFLKVSATTREKRPGEDLYIYLSEEEFLKKQENNEFLETEEVHGFHYGTLKSGLQKAIDNKDIIYMKDVEVHGNTKIRNYLKGKAKVLSIFLDAPDDVLMARLLNRGESEERAKVRLERARLERQTTADYDYIVENVDLDKTIATIEKYIEIEQSK